MVVVELIYQFTGNNGVFDVRHRNERVMKESAAERILNRCLKRKLIDFRSSKTHRCQGRHDGSPLLSRSMVLVRFCTPEFP